AMSDNAASANANLAIKHDFLHHPSLTTRTGWFSRERAYASFAAWNRWRKGKSRAARVRERRQTTPRRFFFAPGRKGQSSPVIGYIGTKRFRQGANEMRFMMLIHHDEAALAAAPQKELWAEYGAFNEALAKAGAATGERLKPSSTATTVRQHGGKT